MSLRKRPVQDRENNPPQSLPRWRRHLLLSSFPPSPSSSATNPHTRRAYNWLILRPGPTGRGCATQDNVDFEHIHMCIGEVARNLFPSSDSFIPAHFQWVLPAGSPQPMDRVREKGACGFVAPLFQSPTVPTGEENLLHVPLRADSHIPREIRNVLTDRRKSNGDGSRVATKSRLLVSASLSVAFSPGSQEIHPAGAPTAAVRNLFGVSFYSLLLGHADQRTIAPRLPVSHSCVGTSRGEKPDGAS